MMENKKYLVLTGTPENFVWSFRDYGRNKLSPSAHGIEPPPELLNKKDNSILWAFNDIKHYQRLVSLLSKNKECFAVLVCNKTQYFDRGVIGFGIIRKEDLVGEVIWDYWPSGEGWNFKFFIEIEEVAPTVAQSIKMLHEKEVLTARDQAATYKLWAESIYPLVPGKVVMGQRFEIKRQIYQLLKSQTKFFWRKWYRETVSEEKGLDYLKEIIRIHLISGKNVIVYGPPGIGKTTLAKQICANMTSGYLCETGNPEWTVFDVIGGFSIGAKKYRKGFLTNAVLRSWNSLKDKGLPYWLLIDEINRANVDLSFGKAFTLMDILHREKETLIPLEEVLEFEDFENYKDFLNEEGLLVPYSFRIVSTMNSYDRALLFKLGFALLRRFSLVPMKRQLQVIRGNADIFSNAAKKLIEETPEKFPNIYEAAKNELLLNREELKDFAVIKKEYYEELRNGIIDNIVFSSELHFGFSLFRLIDAICTTINEEFAETIEIGLGLAMDASKFLVAAYLVYGQELVKYVPYVIDEAVAAYIVPQLDILSERIRAEKMGVSTGRTFSDKIEQIMSIFKELGLVSRSLPLLERIYEGERII